MMKNIRGIYDKTHKKYWFSVRDIIALVLCCDEIKARNYWKWLKRKEKINTVLIKMPCSDGRFRYSDVVDIDQIVEIVMKMPSPKAIAWRLDIMAKSKKWLLQLLMKKAKSCIEMFRQNFKKMTMIITKIEKEYILTKNKVYRDNVVWLNAKKGDDLLFDEKKGGLAKTSNFR